jgi:HEAT repeat protein
MPLIRSSKAGTSSSAPDAALSLSALTLGSADERWAAARACPATPEGIAALSEALLVEPEPHVREAIFTRLAYAATPDSVAAVLPHLRSDDASLRTGALDALRAMAGAVEPYLDSLLSDADADVRLLACEIVRQIEAVRGTRLLCALLEREDQASVCACAVDVLAETGNAEALPVLARLAHRFPEDRFLAFATKVAAERISNQSAPLSEPMA